MIYTLTFSPAIDYVIDLKKLEIGAINRSESEHMMPGGKGINVSIVLSNLGKESVATGFMGGFTGEYVKKELKAKNIHSDFIEVEGNTRINVKIRGEEETAINGQGPRISKDHIEALISKLEKLGKGDLLVISGTIPSSLPDDIYQRILSRIDGNGAELIVDTNKTILLNTLKYHPLLVKPNKEELEEMFETKISTDGELIENAEKLLKLGAKNVIVSLGGDGALLVGEGISPILLPAPKGKVVNTVGAGDSLVAGFIDEYMNSGNIAKAFRRGIATGSASAFSEGLASKEEVEALLNKMA
ncbi:MAG: 1-phosphofructokinase [Bacillota bacterium]|nr:1-phosphofructokinase [Bacillota bacterium]